MNAVEMRKARDLWLLAAAVGILGALLGATQLGWSQTTRPGEPVDRTTVEDARLLKNLAGTVEVWIDGKADKPVVAAGKFAERTRVGDQEFLVFTDGNERVFVKTRQITVMRVK